jgi:hypothetical protein
MLAGHSARLNVDGIELNFADSGDRLQKGMAKSVLPLAPLLDSFLPEYFLDIALLLELPSELELASIGDDEFF